MYNSEYRRSQIDKVPTKYKNRRVADIALILSDRNNPDFEDIRLINSWKMGEVLEAGDFDFWKVTLSDDDNWQYALGSTYVPAIQIDINDMPYSITKNRTVSMCAYNATNEYMSHWLGMKLDVNDSEWYKFNDMCTSDGLQQKYSFTVIQQLVEPYGVGISRIVVPRNTRRFAEYAPFILSLGANPFFMVDGNTTNEEALNKLFPDENLRESMRAKMLSMWRFECSDTPPSGAITMRQFNMASEGHNGGSNYFGPRAKLDSSGWHMSIKLDRLSNISYQKPIVLPEYAEYPGSKTEDIWRIKDKSGKTLREIEAEVSKKNREKAQTLYKPSSYTPPSDFSNKKHLFDLPSKEKDNRRDSAKDKGDDDQVLAYSILCDVCSKDIGNVYVDDMRSCQWCGGMADIEIVDKSALKDGFYIEVPAIDFESYKDYNPILDD